MPNKSLLSKQTRSSASVSQFEYPTLTGVLHRHHRVSTVHYSRNAKETTRPLTRSEKKSTSQSRVRRKTALEIIKHYSRFCFELAIKLRRDRLRLTAVHASICNFLTHSSYELRRFCYIQSKLNTSGHFARCRLALRCDSKWNVPFTNVQEKKISNAYWAPNAEVHPDLGTEGIGKTRHKGKEV